MFFQEILIKSRGRAHNAVSSAPSFNTKYSIFDNEFVIDWKLCPLIGQFDQKASVNCVWSVHFLGILFRWSQKRVQLRTERKDVGKLSRKWCGVTWFSLPQRRFIFNGNFPCVCPRLFCLDLPHCPPRLPPFRADIPQICSETLGFVSGSPICQPCL